MPVEGVDGPYGTFDAGGVSVLILLRPDVRSNVCAGNLSLTIAQVLRSNFGPTSASKSNVGAICVAVS